MSKKVSRRQFLTYTLGGTAGFLGMGMLFPMVRFAADPMLKTGEGGTFVNTKLKVEEFSETPRAVSFRYPIKDGWYKPEGGEPRTAWVMKDKSGNLVALSPVCKHLGCTVGWESNPQFKGEFFCPCHFGRYFKDGTNVPGTPPTKPLDHYETKIEGGYLHIGPVKKA